MRQLIVGHFCFQGWLSARSGSEGRIARPGVPGQGNHKYRLRIYSTFVGFDIADEHRLLNQRLKFN